MVEALDLALVGLAQVEPLVVEEPQDHRLWVARDQPHGHAPLARRAPDLVARHRDRRHLQVVHVHADRIATDHHGPLEDARRPARVPRDGDRRATVEGRSPGHGKAHGELDADIDVGDAPHPVATEERSRTAGLPHDGGVDDGARLDRLVREDLDARPDLGVRPHETTLAEHRLGLASDPLTEIARPADHRTLDPRACPQIAIAQDHAAADLRAVGYPHVRAEDRVLAEDDARANGAVVADHGGSVHHGARVDRGAPAQPHARPQREPLDLDLDAAVQDVLVRPEVGLGGAHVLPVALGDVAVEGPPGLEDRREHLAREVDGPSLGDEVEDLRLEDVDARVDRVAEHLTPRGLFQEPIDGAVLPRDHDAELERVRDAVQRQRGERRLALVEVHDGGKVQIGQDVARDHEEPIVQLLHGVSHGSRGAEGRLLGGVHHADVQLGSVAEVVAHRARHEGHGDDDVSDPVLAKEPHDVLHHRPIGHRQHGLGLIGGEGTESGALAPRHDDRLHRSTSRIVLVPVARVPSGRCARPSRPCRSAWRAGPR